MLFYQLHLISIGYSFSPHCSKFPDSFIYFDHLEPTLEYILCVILLMGCVLRSCLKEYPIDTQSQLISLQEIDILLKVLYFLWGIPAWLSDQLRLKVLTKPKQDRLWCLTNYPCLYCVHFLKGTCLYHPRSCQLLQLVKTWELDKLNQFSPPGSASKWDYEAGW